MSVSGCVSGPIGMHKWCRKVRSDGVDIYSRNRDRDSYGMYCLS